MCGADQPVSAAGLPERGYRSVPHTADLRIEAWAPTREECIAEAVRGLVASFADTGGVPGGQASSRHLPPGSDADLLAAAIDEVIYTLDADGKIPAALRAAPAADGGIDLTFDLADAAAVEIIGAVPKAASLSGLTCAATPDGRWACAVTVDV